MAQIKTPKPRIFTWHVHGSYLYYLSLADIELYLPVDEERSEGYGGKTHSFPWRDNVHEIPVKQVKKADFDLILFQSAKNYLHDQYAILSPSQRLLPKLYLEHDPPREHPTDTLHLAADAGIPIVHVTHFNQLMWDNGDSVSYVIRHGIPEPSVSYQGTLEKGIVVVNNLARRGRRLGADVVAQVKKEVPVDIIGMNSQEVGGLGEIPPQELPAFLARYRFFFNPIRYTSLGLAVCEAMRVGLPIIGFATTELPAVIRDGESGFLSLQTSELIERMQLLLRFPQLAHQMSRKARAQGARLFTIRRFAEEWEFVLSLVIHHHQAKKSVTLQKPISLGIQS